MEYRVTDTELTTVANAIRSKTEGESPITWPDGFVSEIGSISGGGQVEGVLMGSTEPSDSEGEDGNMYYRYTEVPESIMITQGAYFALGVAMSPYYSTLIEFMVVDPEYGHPSCMFGVDRSNSCYALGFNDNGYLYFSYDSTFSSTATAEQEYDSELAKDYFADAVHTVEFKTPNLIVDSNVIYSDFNTYTNDSSDSSFPIFAKATANRGFSILNDYATDVAIARIAVTNPKTGVKICELTPRLNGEGVACLYDSVSESFCTPSGDGTTYYLGDKMKKFSGQWHKENGSWRRIS